MAESSATRIALATFSGAAVRRFASADVDEVLARVDRNASTWIHAVHVGTESSTRILEHFGLPPTLAEQIGGGAALELDTSSDRYVFKNFRFIEDARPLPPNEKKTGFLIRGSESDRLTEGSASIVVAEKLVLLFEAERASPLLARAVEAVLQRKRELRDGRIEYLLYQLAKEVFVDNYSNLLRQGMERLQELEEPLLEGATDAKIYRDVARLRRELNPFERSLLHMGEFVATVAGDTPDLPAGLRSWSGNLANDCARLEKEFSMLRDRASELIQTYRDNVDTQLNKIMRSLTVLSAIFMPLSFITSFYGMNFTSIPAFNWVGGFPIAVAVMLVIAVGGLTFARRRNWL